ncbi:phage tail tape measure protein [Streptomyces sp. NPDC006655]|uniref:phage tail tape measure protein n=1 Tax=Streptomyces sp. NPDC006655 TaxID=3156898 RepID=UPI00345326DC
MSQGTLLPPVVVRLMGDITQLKGTLAEARTRVDGTAGGFKKAGATAYAGLATMGRSVSLIGAGVAVASTKMAADFQSETLVLHTAAGESLKGLQTVRQGIKDVAADTGTTIPNLTDGMYQVEKAGYRGAQGITVLKAAAQGAREENAQLSTVTNAMTSVMASYHYHASDSVRVMNALKTAAGEGKMTMEEFAGSLSTVLPLASANKIGFDQVAGALATLTQHGTSAREGTQELASTIRNLAKPNDVAVKEMQRFGLSSIDVSTKLGKRGLTGTLDMLSKAVLSKMGPSGTVLISAFNKSTQAAKDADTMVRSMPKGIQSLARSYSSGKLSLADWRQALKGLPPEQANLLSQYATLQNKTHGFSDALKKGGPAAKTYTDAIARMTGGAIGLNTTLQLTGKENMAGFNDRVEKIGKSLNHSSKDVEGWKETSKSLNVQMAQLKQRAEVLAIDIGTKLIPVVSAVITFFVQHKTAAAALAAVIGGVLALSVVAYTAKVVTSGVKSLSAFGRMGMAGINMGRRVAQGFKDARVAESAFSGKAGSFGGILRKGWDASVSGSKRAISGVRTFATTVGRATKAGAASAWTGMVNGVKAVGLAMKTAALASWNFAKATAASTLAAIRSAAAWAVQKVQVAAAAIAEKAAATAQWLLNMAMMASPLTLVVIAIVALVAGLILAYNKIGWFRAFVDTAFRGIAAVIGWVVGFVKSHWQLMLVLITGPIGLAIVLVIKYWSQISSAVSTAVSWVVGFVKSHWQLLLGLITGPIGLAVDLVIKYWGKISSGFSDAYKATVSVGRSLGSWVSGLPGRIYGYLSSLGSGLSSRASTAWSEFKSATVAKATEAITWVRGVPGRARAALGNLGSYLYSSGRALLQGFVSGIKSMVSAAVNATHSVLSSVSDLFPHSPAKTGPFSGRGWTLHSGRALMDGLAQGIRENSSNPVAIMRGAAQATSDAFAKTLGIASPSRVFRSLGIYVNEGLVDGLTGSTARVKAATRRIESLLIQTYNKVADLKGTKGVSNRWVKSHEATLKKLEANVKKEDKLLRSLAAKRDSVAAQLKTAQSKLKSLQKQWSDQVKSTADGIKQGFSIVTEAPQDGVALTAQDVLNKMRDQMAKAVQFSAQLQALKKKGLSSDLIAQIAAAGVDQGGATAAALSGATKSQIDQINAVNKTTNAAATNAGKAVADSMYGSGIKAAQGLVKGLQSQEKKIEQQMLKIAKSMQKAIKKALGIHSPSRVFAAIGQWIPRGLAAGVDDGATHATGAISRLAASMVGASDFTGSGMSLAAAAGGGTVIHQTTVHVEVKGHVLTEKNLRDVVEKQMLRLGARNSKTYEPYKR